MEAKLVIRGKGEQGVMPAPSPLPCLPEGAGGVVFCRTLLLTPSLPKDRAPEQTNILFCAEKCA